MEITNTNSKLIVFAPDPLSNVNGVETYGFDELTATKKISDILDSNSFGFTFVLKVHPNQNLEKLKFVLGNKIVIAQSNVDSNILIFYADAIIGFFSNFLIEADIMHKKVLRYHPAIIKNDPFAELGVGKKISDAQLIEELTMLDDAGK